MATWLIAAYLAWLSCPLTPSGELRRLVLLGFSIGWALLFYLTGCAPAPAPRPYRFTDPRDAIVQVMCETIDYDGERQIRKRFPCCNAFATRDGPSVVLNTAAHCLQGAQVGEAVPYVTRADALAWVHPEPLHARVLSIDADWDRATLAPDVTAPALVTLAKGARTVKVRACAASYGWSYLDGSASSLAQGYTDSTLDVRPGWSGAPVLNMRAEVVGIVVMCSADISGACRRNAGVFVSF